MKIENVLKILELREGISVEFKQSQKKLPDNLFESICAMLNRIGGDLLLGVKNNGEVVGVDPDYKDKLKTDLVNLSNNPTKIDPPFMLFPEEVLIHGRTVIYVRVPQSSQVHKTNQMIFDRNQDGDFQVKTHEATSRLYQRKSGYFTENKIFPYIQFYDFDQNVIQKARNLIKSHRPDHPWLNLSDRDLLRSAGLFRKEFESGEEGYTMAAALLIGRDELIQQILPAYKTDALLRRGDMDHYDDRREIRTNLVDAYDALMHFVQLHLPDKFFLEGDIRVDLREKVFREIIANIIIHREYTNAFPAKLIIYGDKLYTENANNPVGYGPIDPNNFNPHPKNPLIVKFFQQLGRAEELGSGIRNIRKYLPLYTGKTDFSMIEEDIFKIIINLGEQAVTSTYQPDIENVVDLIRNDKLNTIMDMVLGYLGKGWQKTEKGLVENTEKVGRKRVKRLVINQVKIIAVLMKSPQTSKKKLADLLGVSTTAIDKNMDKLKSYGLIIRKGPAKGGKWILVNDSQRKST
ncbi:MAG TPA: HTH domain-containing protein [Candidatus Marinimicrobia bacterium]|nr:HTH domain-containing protein [Candidatus Neomarinimicrobiota bacterium]